jgi:RNA polymerase subunit RPABC4/transcription elongation factor Spt4
MARMTSCKACGAMISAEASLCPHCGANFNRIAVVQVGLAIMLAIAVLYALFERYSGWLN